MGEKIMNNQVLLINDLAGYGKVALTAMIPVLSHLNISVQSLPTALVSNTLDYGKFDILDTTAYMQNTLKIWDELGFSFDAIATGFITNVNQALLINEYCHRESKKGSLILCDPIMGDEGSLYPGMDASKVDEMRQLISCADYVVPNYTEATLIANKEYTTNPSNQDIKECIDELRAIGSKSVIITSVQQNAKYMVCCYDHQEDRYFNIEYQNIDVRFPGTGDIFSSVLLGSLMNGSNLETSVKEAMDIVVKMIKLSLDNKDLYKGIEIEKCLGEIDG